MNRKYLKNKIDCIEAKLCVINDTLKGGISTNSNLVKSKLVRLETEADDLIKTFVFLDPGAADERVSTITYTSAELSLSVTKTFVYAGSSPNFRILTITLT